MSSTKPAVPQVSATARTVWAKSGDDRSMSLARHLADTAAVAGHLWDTFLPRAVRSQIVAAVGDAGLARRLAVWSAAGHDLGKATPAFAVQVEWLCERMVDAGLEVRLARSEGGRRKVPHSEAGFWLWTRWLEDRGVPLETAWSLASPSGGHHGLFPDEGNNADALPGTVYTGDSDTWSRVQDEYADYVAELAGLTTEDIDRLAAVQLPQTVQVVLTGMTTMADWIASNERWFPIDDFERSSADRADAAWADLSFPPPWRPVGADPEQIFPERFGLDASMVRPSQHSAAEVAAACDEPELLIIEAPTGEGKTFAALAAAEIMATSRGAGGLAFALPTRATSDAMFTTVHTWLARTVPAGERASLVLAHGQAQFNEEYQGLLGRGRFRSTGIHDGGAGGEVTAHWWLAGRKSAALAGFVVCTIDQVLFAALNSRHVTLRHLGLAGKVVVLDEIHAADTFMSVYLTRAIEWLAAYGVPVVALSATLPPQQRTALIAAYNRGRGRKRSAVRGGQRVIEGARGYPLITASGPDGGAAVAAPPSGRAVEYRLTELPGDIPAIAQAVLSEAAGGGCIAVVCDTVNRAQQMFSALEPVLGDDVVLLHSRFIADQRVAKETVLRAEIGPGTISDGGRPRRRVVVATQVVEQSLDLDFDLMFTDIAPVDLLIQRAGRLHRHARPADARPPAMRHPRLIITGVTRDKRGVPSFAPGIARVYPKILLLKTLAVLDAHGDRLHSPADVADLVRQVYSDDLPAPAEWAKLWHIADEREAARKRDQDERAKMFRLDGPRTGRSMRGWNAMRTGDADEEAGYAQVRDSEDAFEVVVVQRIGGRIVAPPWTGELAGTPLAEGTVIDDDLAKTVARWTVRLPAYLGTGGLGDAVLADLEAEKIDAWQNSRWLAGVLALVLDEEGRAQIADFNVTYDTRRGLLVNNRSEDR